MPRPTDDAIQDQALALVTAASLQAGCYGALPWAIGWLALLFKGMSVFIWVGVCLCSIVGGYALFRIALDAWLFKCLGQGMLSVSAMDRALLQMFGGREGQAERSMIERVLGARRWLLRWFLLVVLQWLLIGLGMVLSK